MDDVPTLILVLAATSPNFQVGMAWMAQEFLEHNNGRTRATFAKALHGIEFRYEPHVDFKKRVPSAISLIRTGDTTQYANIILESAKKYIEPTRQNAVYTPLPD